MAAIVLGEFADRIREHLTGQLASVIEVGKLLNEVKGVLPHGEFQDWVKKEFGWSRNTTSKYMRGANLAIATSKSNSGVTFEELPIQPSALFEMAAPSFPSGAKAELLELAELGTPVTKEVAAETKRKYKPKKEDNGGKQLCPGCENYQPVADFDGSRICFLCRQSAIDEIEAAADSADQDGPAEDWEESVSTAGAPQLTPLERIKAIWDACNVSERREIQKEVEKWNPRSGETMDWNAAFTQFWKVVHCKKAKPKAFDAFKKAVKRKANDDDLSYGDAAWEIVTAMQEFASTPEADPKDHSAIHPTTWLNQGRYDDDRSTWRSKNGTSQHEALSL